MTGSPTQAPSSEPPERRLAILFTDVEGSTEFRNRRGDAFADEVLGIHESIVRGQIAAHGGDEMLFLGDGFMASFATVGDALRSAIGMQQELEAHSEADPERRVRVRIGVHVGDVTIREGTLYGQAVHAASRVAALAAGGQIFVSEAAREEAGPNVTAIDRGLFWLKGFPERWRVFEVDWGGGRATAAATIGLAPFVERERERADLRHALNTALAGHGSLVFVTGEPGVGKSRLVQEVAAEATARGMRVLVGHSIEMQGAIPYLPFVELFEQALAEMRDPKAFRGAMGDAGPEIARMVPSLRRAMPDLPPPIELPPEQARRYLWVSVQEYIERASHVQPLLFFLEDLHWADESTLLLLEHLAPALGQMPVLIIGTYRNTEVGPMHPLARTMNQLGRRRLLTRITLERLTQTGVAALVRGLARQEPPDELVRVIHSESEGNPYFTEEVYLHLSESGRLLDEEGRFRPDLHIAEFDVPETVRLVVGERLGRLTDRTRDVLTAAATSGRTFEPQVVARVAEVDSAALLTALDEAERAFVIGPAEAGGRQSFTHELTRQTLLANASSVMRQDLHARTAGAIESLHADDVEDRAAEIASHLVYAGSAADPQRLVHHLLLAGDQAAAASAFDEAVAHFERARGLVPESARETRAGILERLAMAMRSIGRWDDALRTMNAALDLYEALGRTEAIGRLAWAMVYQLSWGARFEEAVAVAQRALGALGEALNADRARIASAAAWAIGLTGDHDTSTAMFAQARGLAEHVGDTRALADIQHMETINHLGFAELEQGIASGLAAAKVFEADGALWDLASVLSFAGYEAGTIPRPEEASALVARAAPLAERFGHLGATFMTLADRVRREGVLAGDLDAVERLGHQIVEVCERGGLPWLYVGHMYVGLAAHWRGDNDEAEGRLRIAVGLEPPAAFAGQCASLLALHLAYAGRSEEALATIEGVRGAFPVAGRVNTLGSWNVGFAAVEVFAIVGRSEEAAALYPVIMDALEHRGEWGTFDVRLTHTRAAIAAAAAKQWIEAEGHFRAALKTAETLQHRIELADVRRLYARMLFDRNAPGDPERARELLAEAVEEYRSMGMPGFEALVSAMLGEGGER